MTKIIVLEDDQDIREVVEWILKSEDYEVISFASINEFMHRDKRVLPHLFLLDVRLPDGSGLEVCKQLKTEHAKHRIPVLMMSAHASLAQVENGCAADGFIQKPFELNHFIRTIRDQIRTHH